MPLASSTLSMLKRLPAGLLLVGVLALFSGCAHRETAQAAVDTREALIAVANLHESPQSAAIARAALPLLDGIIMRESDETVPPMILAADWVAATATPPDAYAQAKVTSVSNTHLAALDSAKKTDQLISAGGDTLTWLLSLTGAGGLVTAAGLRIFSAFKTVKQAAQVGWDGYHQAQSVLKVLSPTLSKHIDDANIHIQSRLPAPVAKLSDAFVAKAQADAAVALPASLAPTPAPSALEPKA